jgi:hypothetical protein
MIPRFVPALFLLIIAPFALAAPDAPRMSKQTRMDLIRAFNAELVYVRTPFPMGKKGLTVKDGEVTPNGEELQQMMALWGPAAKPGDRAMITDIRIKDDLIHFEINGGPVKRKKWYQHIEVGGATGSTPIAPGDAEANPRGSFVDLLFDHYVPEMNPQELKERLRPVFDFDAKSAAEAYMETVPPKVKEAIKEHRVLVGMNREMVMYSKGRAPKKVREKQDENEFEEWIYGEPPQAVDFVRFIGDEVVRVETMQVNGEKTLRTEKEVDLEASSTVAKKTDLPDEPSTKAPSLRRPGEASETDSPADGPDRPQQPTAPPVGPPQIVQTRY